MRPHPVFSSLRPPLLATLLLAAGPAGAADPVGVDTCRKCHPAAVAVWEKGPHAKAERGLGPRADEKACRACHAPLRGAKQAGVSCEACHGAGGHYAKGFVMRDAELSRAVGLVVPGEKECRACHTSTSPALLPFDFAAKVALLEHGKADREARKAPPAGTKLEAPAKAGGGRR